MAQFGPHAQRVFAKPRKGKRPSITAHIIAAKQQAATKSGFAARADELRAYLDANPDTYVVAHGTYMDYPWYGKPYPAKFIRKELAMCARAGIAGVVVHLGIPGVKEVKPYLPRLMRESRGGAGPVVYLEVPHVQPHKSHYETPEKLAALFRVVRQVDPQLRHFGLCIDTAHLWSCGVDLSSRAAGDDWIQRLEAVAGVIPPGRILLHLNDSESPLGSGTDKHAPLLCGRMWGEYRDCPSKSGLVPFVEYAIRHNIPTILEHKPEFLEHDYQVLNKMAPGVFKPS